ncbi:hypothetical protein T484DRAFT_1879543 [Baffinella frigidus]|nr:hypothetical protein T484DRAFT_1879543 [Cryptophyta sp. CCMP2293]
MCKQTDAAYEAKAATTFAKPGDTSLPGASPSKRSMSPRSPKRRLVSARVWGIAVEWARFAEQNEEEEVEEERNEDEEEDEELLHDVLVVGLESNSIHLVSQTEEEGQAGCVSEAVVFSHAQGPLLGVAAHPTKTLYVSMAADGSVCLWDVQTRRLVSQHRLWVPKPIWGGGARAQQADHRDSDTRNLAAGTVLDISREKDSRLVVGMSDGSVRVLGVDYTGITVLKGHHSKESPVCCARFSYKADIVAIAYTDNVVQIFQKDTGTSALPLSQDWGFQLHRTVSISGSGSLDFLDWTMDNHFIQGATSTSEQLYLDVDKGRQACAPPSPWNSPAGRLVNARVTGHADAEANCPR